MKASPTLSSAPPRPCCIQDVRQAAGQWRESKVQGALDAGAYHASKLALNRVVQLLADDPQLAQTKVAVVAADPGWCRTDMGGKVRHA